MPSLGDFGDSARDRGAIDIDLCTQCRHGCHRLGDIDCRHQPWTGETPAALLVRAWLHGQRGRDCPCFTKMEHP